MKGHRGEILRDRVTQAAQDSRPYGKRTEELFPLRPAGLNDIDVRQGDVFDQSGEQLIGIDTSIGLMMT